MTDLSTGTAPARDWRRRVRLWLRRYALFFYVLILGALLGVLALGPRIFIQIPAGHVGVLWMRFYGGTVIDKVYGEGVRLILPWDVMTFYDTRLQSDTRTYRTLSANGLAMEVEVSLRYRINPPAAGLLHKLAGPRYGEALVAPEVAAVALEMFASYTPEQVYSELRGSIQEEIRRRILARFAPPGSASADVSAAFSPASPPPLIAVENALVRSVTLPPTVRAAIEAKFEQQQRMLEYEFRIAREEKERERKRIEAEGIRFFQDTVAATITPEYLRLRGIEATSALAASPNSKIVIIGGKDGLPVILNPAEGEFRAVTPPPVAPEPLRPPLIPEPGTLLPGPAATP